MILILKRMNSENQPRLFMINGKKLKKLGKILHVQVLSMILKSIKEMIAEMYYLIWSRKMFKEALLDQLKILKRRQKALKFISIL